VGAAANGDNGGRENSVAREENEAAWAVSGVVAVATGISFPPLSPLAFALSATFATAATAEGRKGERLQL
jgi:hypothetical protein